MFAYIEDSMTNQFDKFYQAQAKQYDNAKSELSTGSKKTHWIWFIFPQLKVLGYSQTAKYYGIQDIHEACEYLKDTKLYNHYYEILSIAHNQLSQSIPLFKLMGGHPDDYKFISSLTLFHQASQRLIGEDIKYHRLNQLCQDVFDIVERQGYGPCQTTLAEVKKNSMISKVKRKSLHEDNSHFFQKPKSKLINDTKQSSDLRINLEHYILQRQKEWDYHFNFMGIVSFIYLIQDFFLGTKYYDSKNKEVKIRAAEKIRNGLENGLSLSNITSVEKNALNDGRLGSLINAHGGLEHIVSVHCEQIPKNTPKADH